MVLNNRAADPEAHPHSLWLGRVKSLKKPRGVRAAEAHAGIAHLDDRRRLAIEFSNSGYDPQSSLAVCDVRHCLDSVLDKVQHHLLQLNAVPTDRGQAGGQVQQQINTML